MIRDDRLTRAAEIIADRSIHNLNWQALARETGLSPQTLKRHFKAGYKEKERVQRSGYAKRYPWRQHHRTYNYAERHQTAFKADVAARLAEIPKEDNRTFTQRFCGDPPAGRSALDREGRRT